MISAVRVFLAITCVGVLAGCDDDCLGYGIEVRAYSGPEITGTAITCEGDELADWTPCWRPDFSFITEPLDDCGSLQLSLGGAPVAALNVVLYLDGSTEVEGARVTAAYLCDNLPCPPPELRPVLGGFVAAQDFSPRGRNRGEFELEFEEGTISGTYDAVAR